MENCRRKTGGGKLWGEVSGHPGVHRKSRPGGRCSENEAELEEYKKSGDKYLDRVDFLKRAELREYEKERDARLGADVRNRGRL